MSNGYARLSKCCVSLPSHTHGHSTASPSNSHHQFANPIDPYQDTLSSYPANPSATVPLSLIFLSAFPQRTRSCDVVRLGKDPFARGPIGFEAETSRREAACGHATTHFGSATCVGERIVGGVCAIACRYTVPWDGGGGLLRDLQCGAVPPLGSAIASHKERLEGFNSVVQSGNEVAEGRCRRRRMWVILRAAHGSSRHYSQPLTSSERTMHF